MKKKTKVIGIMTGTSLDGCDFVLIEIYKDKSKIKCHFLDQFQVKIPNSLLKQTQLVTSHKNFFSSLDLTQLHFEWGSFYSKALSQVIKKRKWDFDLIGLHGQTVAHKGKKLTCQIGSPHLLAATFKVPVVYDFRSMDVALGYEGAPLAPLFHKVIWGDQKSVVSIHNLGGMSNLTLIDKGQIKLAFDTGPANLPLDSVMSFYTKNKKKFDQDGKIAQSGVVNEKLFNYFVKHSFFKIKPPKSCGREEFGPDWILNQIPNKMSLEEAMATVTEGVAFSIANAYKKFVKPMPEKILFCGGGAKNLFLLERIQTYLPEVTIGTTETHGWPVFSLEGGAFAYLAWARKEKVRHKLTQTTGNPSPIYLGSICEV